MRDSGLYLLGVGVWITILFIGASIYDLVKPLGLKDCKDVIAEATAVYNYGAQSIVEERVQGVTLTRVIATPCAFR